MNLKAVKEPLRKYWCIWYVGNLQQNLFLGVSEFGFDSLQSLYDDLPLGVVAESMVSKDVAFVERRQVMDVDLASLK